MIDRTNGKVVRNFWNTLISNVEQHSFDGFETSQYSKADKLELTARQNGPCPSNKWERIWQWKSQMPGLSALNLTTTKPLFGTFTVVRFCGDIKFSSTSCNCSVWEQLSKSECYIKVYLYDLDLPFEQVKAGWLPLGYMLFECSSTSPWPSAKTYISWPWMCIGW